jgi:hypothetical protein
VTSPIDAVALETRQAQIAIDREKRIAEHKAQIAASHIGTKTLAARRGGESLNILAEGDSWFDYPLSRDTIGWIQRGGPPFPLILNLAHHGDIATEMLGVAQRRRIIENLTDPANGTFDALLFSAGGNDIAGDQFCLWVRTFVAGNDPSHGLDEQRLAAILGVVNAAYVDLIQIRDQFAPDCVIFFHGYDFALPDGRDVCGVGPWLKPSLDLRGWTDPAMGAEIVKRMLKALDRLLLQIEQQNRNVVYVRTQGTLSSADWANELHPTESGFGKIADVFLKALRKKFHGRI